MAARTSRPASGLRALIALIAFVAAALTAVAVGWAQAAPPPPTRWVTDDAGFLSAGTRQALDSKLEAHERSTGHQVVVWIGNTIGDQPIEEWSARTFEAWKLGRKGIDDGLAVFILADDRKISIEVGYGLEERVPDAIASRIINDTMVPRLRADDRDGAVRAGVDALLTQIEGGKPVAGQDQAPPPASDDLPRIGPVQLVIVGLLAVGFLILLVKNPSLALWILFAIFRGGRGGGGRDGSGGGFSGGGGRSGGGGARGSW